MLPVQKNYQFNTSVHLMCVCVSAARLNCLHEMIHFLFAQTEFPNSARRWF